MDKDLVEIENSLIFLLIVLHELRLIQSSITHLIWSKPTLGEFVFRNKNHSPRAGGILIL
jgi:hypothetical protein